MARDVYIAPKPEDGPSIKTITRGKHPGLASFAVLIIWLNLYGQDDECAHENMNQMLRSSACSVMRINVFNFHYRRLW